MNKITQDFDADSCAGILVSTDGIVHVLIRRDTQPRKRGKNTRDDFSFSKRGVLGLCRSSHQHEITVWVVGLTKSAQNNQSSVNAVYFGVCRCAIDGQPMLPWIHRLNSGIVHRNLKCDTILVTDSIANEGFTVRDEGLALVPLDVEVHLFGRFGTGKTEAVKIVSDIFGTTF